MPKLNIDVRFLEEWCHDHAIYMANFEDITQCLSTTLEATRTISIHDLKLADHLSTNFEGDAKFRQLLKPIVNSNIKAYLLSGALEPERGFLLLISLIRRLSIPFWKEPVNLSNNISSNGEEILYVMEKMNLLLSQAPILAYCHQKLKQYTSFFEMNSDLAGADEALAIDAIDFIDLLSRNTCDGVHEILMHQFSPLLFKRCLESFRGSEISKLESCQPTLYQFRSNEYLQDYLKVHANRMRLFQPAPTAVSSSTPLDSIEVIPNLH